MNCSEDSEITGILDAVARGESDSAARLLPLVYDELLRLARARMARLGPCQSLTPTELVHEAYLRVVGGKRECFEGRRHFIFAVNRAMSDHLVERARRTGSLKRGGNYLRLPVEVAEQTTTYPQENILDLLFALKKLERESPGPAQVVRLSYFGGLTHPEIAEVLGLSRATVERRWTEARIWLRRELSQVPASRRGKAQNV
ncbi:MAG TPA: ECF-type sigma factor [Thermoanaerobaculia bacterium]|nr:ECF-type sigma factor [Thermoanaerobaculia bacterium]